MASHEQVSVMLSSGSGLKLGSLEEPPNRGGTVSDGEYAGLCVVRGIEAFEPHVHHHRGEL